MLAGPPVVPWSVVRGPPATRLLLGRGGLLWPLPGEAPDQADHPGRRSGRSRRCRGRGPRSRRARQSRDGGAPPHARRRSWSAGCGVHAGCSPQHSFGPGQVLTSPVAHTHALRPRAPRSAVRAAPAACAALGVVSSASASKQPGSPRPVPAARRPWQFQPRQHVAQAGDPQPQRGKYGPTGLVFFYTR